MSNNTHLTIINTPPLFTNYLPLSKIIFGLLTLFLFSSCYSTGRLIEAQSLEEGEQLMQIKTEASVLDRGNTGDFFQTIDALYVYGANSKYDIGFFLSTGASIGLHNKYELLDRERHDLSLGLDARVFVFSRINSQLTPVLYYTHTKPGKRKILINPALNIETFNLNYNKGTYFSPNLTIARQQYGKNWTLGYTVSYNVFNNRSFSHSLSIAYNIRY